MTSEPHVEELGSQPSSRLQAVAGRVGCTEGQLYTAVIGLVMATGLAVLGVPPTLRAPLAASPTATPSQAAALPPPVAVPTPGSPVTPSLAALPPLVSQPAPEAPALGSGVATEPSSGPGPVTAAPEAAVISVFAQVGEPGVPAAVASLPDGDVVVGTNNTADASRVLVFNPAGALQRSIAVPGQPEERTSGLTAAGADASGHAFFLDASTSRVLQLDPAGKTLSTRTTIPNVPPCLLGAGASACEPGLHDRAGHLSAVAVDAHGSLYVADAGQGIIWRLLSTDTVAQPWYSSADLATGDGPAGVAFDKQGRLLFTAGTTNDIANAGNGGLYGLVVNDDGTAGTRTLLHSFGQGERPGALAVGSSGTSYVVTRGSGAIVSINSKGAEVGRLAPPGDGRIPLDTPSGLAMTPGHLLVANQGSATKRASWAVLKVLVEDTPVVRTR